MSTKVKVQMKPVNVIVNSLGVGKNGDVQRFVTNTVNRRITRYMPMRSGMLSTKLKVIKNDAEIEVIGPYARYQYYGKAMEGKAPMVATERDLRYDKTKNPLAGPFWDKRMMAAEGEQIAAETQSYIDRKAGK